MILSALGRYKELRLESDSPSFTVVAPKSSLSERTLILFEQTLNFKVPMISMQKEKGINGAYLIQGKKGPPAAVFKPSNEEGNRLVGDDGERRLKLGMKQGDAAMNECISFYLGSKYGISLPATAFLTLSSPALEQGSASGSVQEFKNGKTFKSLSPEETDALLKTASLKEFHDLFFMDLLTGNTDRHSGNLLVEGNKFNKIDHGCCLTASLANPENYCWLKWNVKALHTPFDSSLVSHFDWEKDAREIQEAFPGFSAEALRILNLRMHLLQKGTLAGLTPFELAQFFGLFGAMSIIYSRIDVSFKSEKETFGAIESAKKSIDACIVEPAAQKKETAYDSKKA